MLGVGPGALPTDAAMLGLEPPEMRPLLHEYMQIVMQLLTTEEPVNYESDRLKLVDARLHLRPYSQPLFDIAVAAVASPSGAKLAGQYGAGVLSLGATVAVGMDVLAHHWTIQEEVAAAHGQVADRDKWRLVGLMHLAESKRKLAAMSNTASSSGSGISRTWLPFPKWPLTVATSTRWSTS